MFGRIVLEYEIGLEQSRAQAEVIRGERDLLQLQYAEANAGLASVRDDRDRFAAQLARGEQLLAEARVRASEQQLRAETVLAETQADRNRLLTNSWL